MRQRILLVISAAARMPRIRAMPPGTIPPRRYHLSLHVQWHISPTLFADFTRRPPVVWPWRTIVQAERMRHIATPWQREGTLGVRIGTPLSSRYHRERCSSWHASRPRLNQHSRRQRQSAKQTWQPRSAPGRAAGDYDGCAQLGHHACGLRGTTTRGTHVDCPGGTRTPPPPAEPPPAKEEDRLRSDS